MDAIHILENVSDESALEFTQEIIDKAKEIILRRQEHKIVLALEQKTPLTIEQEAIMDENDRKERIITKLWHRLAHREGPKAANDKYFLCKLKDDQSKEGNPHIDKKIKHSFVNEGDTFGTGDNNCEDIVDNINSSTNMLRQVIEFLLRLGYINMSIGIDLIRVDKTFNEMVQMPNKEELKIITDIKTS